MPQLPYNYGVPDQSPLPTAPNAYFSENAPAGAFGAYQAEALQKGARDLSGASSNIADAVIRRQELYNKSATEEAYNQLQDFYHSKEFGDPNTPGDVGIYGLKGRAAMDAGPGVLKELDQKRQEIVKGLQNDAQRLAFASVSRRLQLNTADAIGRHIDLQSSAWAVDTARAGGENAGRHAASFYNDEGAFNDAVEQGRRSAVQEIQASGNTSDPEIVKATYNKYIGKVIMDRAGAWAASGDAAGALDWLRNGKTPPITLPDGKVVPGTSFSEIVDPRAMDAFVSHYSEKVQDDAASAWVTQQMGGGPAAPLGLHNAIKGQEGSRPDQTSPKGAVGAMQVTPGFFRQYAKPGESFENEDDRVAVANRGIDALNTKYNGDAARVAVAYFSGDDNVAPAGSPTPWRENKNDGRTTVAQYVNGVLTRLNGAPQAQPATPGQMPDREAIVRNAIQTFGGNEKVLEKVLGKVARQFSIVDAATAADRRTLTESMPDMERALLAGVDVPIPEDKIRAVFQPQEADHHITQLQVAKSAGQIMSAIQYGSPQDVQGALADLTGGMGTLSAMLRAKTNKPGQAATIAVPDSAASGTPVMETPEQFGMRTRIAEAARRAIQARAESLVGPNADPAQYVAAEPSVASARAAVMAAPEADKPAAIRAMATTMLGVQDHLGVPSSVQRVLTAGQAQALTQQITAPDADAKTLLDGLQKQWGDLWPHVFGDLVALGKLPSAYQSVAVLDDPRDAAMLARAINETSRGGRDWNDILGNAGGKPVAGGIRDAVRNDPTVMQLERSLSASGASAQQIDGVVQSIETLAFAKRFYNQDGTAAQNAIKAFTDKYEFLPNGGARVPAKLADDVTRRAQAMLWGAELEKQGALPAAFTGTNHLAEADAALHLTPQERFLYQHHLTNLNGAGKVIQPNGDISTVEQMSFERDGRTYNIPTVWNGKELKPDDAIAQAERVGLDKFPSYGSEDEAEGRYQAMHAYLDRDTSDYRKHVGPDAQDYWHDLRANPTWITSPKADALWLMDRGGRIVRDQSGKPIAVPFNAPIGSVAAAEPAGTDMNAWLGAIP